MENKMVEIENVSFRYGRKNYVFQDFSLEIGKGEIVGLLGENAVGKSTLLYLISGLLRPLQGKICVKGIDVCKRKVETLGDIFLVPEEFDLPNVSLKRYINLNAPFYPKFSMETMYFCLDSFGLTRDIHLKELSISLTYAIGIDLSNCSRLEKFKCTAVLEPVKITLPKYFPLKEFTFDDTIWWCFTKRQFKKIVSVIEHNGGKMVNALMLREYPHSEFFLQPGQAQNHPAQSCHYMREQIKMAVSPFRKRYIACIAVLLDDGPCEIDWGDRHKSRLDAKGREWLYGVHVYSQSIPRQVAVTSEAGKIVGLIAENLLSLNGVAVDAVDISRCPSLRYFAADGMSHLNVSTNPELQIIDLSNCYCTSIDFSNSTGLEHLYIGTGLGGPNPKVQSLDLAKCKRLQTLGIRHSTDLNNITIAGDSPLMQFTCDDYTPLNEAAVRNLQQVIARNGGQFTKITREDEENNL